MVKEVFENLNFHLEAWVLSWVPETICIFLEVIGSLGLFLRKCLPHTQIWIIGVYLSGFFFSNKNDVPHQKVVVNLPHNHTCAFSLRQPLHFGSSISSICIPLISTQEYWKDVHSNNKIFKNWMFFSFSSRTFLNKSDFFFFKLWMHSSEEYGDS